MFGLFSRLYGISKSILLTILTISIPLATLIYFNQNKLLYINFGFEVPMVRFTPSEMGIHTWREEYIETDDGERLHAWLLWKDDAKITHSEDTQDSTDNVDSLRSQVRNRKSTNSNSNPSSSTSGEFSGRLLVYFHGNAGDISGRIKNVCDLYSTQNHLDGILIVDYRGYGFSTGKPSESGLFLDAKGTIKWAKNNGFQNIILFGRSLGGAVAIDAASRLQSQIEAVIVENTFTSIHDMIDVIFPSLRWFKVLSWNKWKSIEKVDNITKPILFVSGAKDELVPPRMMNQLFNQCKSSKKELKVFENGDHNGTFMDPEYYSVINEWLSRLDQ